MLRRIGYAVPYLPWLALLAWLAGGSWHLNEDAFISFRYARNLLEGHGLVFNPGERVEGYTNFLWTLELAGIWGLFGIRPEHAAPWLSVFYTAATIAALLWWAARLPGLRCRGLAGWMALGLVCSSGTFAVWTSAGGLETRQFTFFVVAAVVGLSLHRNRRRGLLAASISLALAELTRPEGLLIAGCCIGWFMAQRAIDAGRLRWEWRELACLIGPFAAVVIAHFLFRYGYYGEWLPNTYYAKFVRPWWDAGVRYYAAAGLETGLYLLLPLAAAGLWARWRAARDGSYGLALLVIALHAVHIMRVGGDNFEWRPLDFYWPLLALPAAEGIVYLGAQGALALRRALARGAQIRLSRLEGWGTGIGALGLFALTLFYGNALQVALHIEGNKPGGASHYITLPEERSAGWLWDAPGMRALNAARRDLLLGFRSARIARSYVHYRARADDRMARWQPYESALRGAIPEDALMVTGSIGILPYYVPDLKIIDAYGLADKTVARNPVTKPNSARSMAHDRFPPPGYLEGRGVNFRLIPPATSVDAALRGGGTYAVPIDSGVWMPFNSPYHQWVTARFRDRGLRSNYDRIAQVVRAGTRVGSADWDVYMYGNTLVYHKESCAADNIYGIPRFFLHLVPVDETDLPPQRREHGFDNRGFSFVDKGKVIGKGCATIRLLPDYDIAEIRTGQFTADGEIWSVGFTVGPELR